MNKNTIHLLVSLMFLGTGASLGAMDFVSDTATRADMTNREYTFDRYKTWTVPFLNIEIPYAAYYTMASYNKIGNIQVAGVTTETRYLPIGVIAVVPVAVGLGAYLIACLAKQPIAPII